MDESRLLEYTSAAVPVMDDLTPMTFDPEAGGVLETPNLSVQYIRLSSQTPTEIALTTATSHVFYVLEGCGTTVVPSGPPIEWNKDDVFTFPCYDSVTLQSDENAVLFYANDAPLLRFLGAAPNQPRFLPTHYKREDIIRQMTIFNQQEGSDTRNRNGILLTNAQMVDERLNTITHTMWSLINCIFPHATQPPHRHNSVAVDMCIWADESHAGKVYTLMGKELNEHGAIIDPIKFVWKTGWTFTTPPGWWHSHHNESSEVASVFPVQDAGLHTHMRTLDIHFASNPEC